MRLLRMTVIAVGLAGAAGAQQPLADIPFKATITDTSIRRLADGNVVKNTAVGDFFRDEHGRVRIVRKGQISIQDPVAGFSAVLNTDSRTAAKLLFPKRQVQGVSSPPSPQVAGDSNVPTSSMQRPERVDLGKKTVSGFLSTGTQFTTTVPVGVVGNILPIVRTTEVWISDELHVPLVIKSSDSLNGEHTTIYDNINLDSPIDPSLFVIPPDYHVTTKSMDTSAKTPPGFQPNPESPK